MMRRVAMAVVVSTWLAGCAGAPFEPPAIPDPDLTGMEPLVVGVLRESREAVVSDPRSAEAWGRLGGAYHAHGLLAEADVCYRAAAGLAPNDFRWAYLRAVARDEAGGEPKMVLPLYNEAARLQSEYAPMHVRVGRILLRHGRHELAHKSFARAAKLDPQLASAQLGMGQAFLSEGTVQVARIAFEHAAALTPDDAAVQAGLARALEEEGRPDDARRAAALARGSVDRKWIADPVVEKNVHALGAATPHWVERALERIALGDFDEALKDLQPPLALHPAEPDLLVLKALANRGLGDATAAEDALARSVLGTPDHVPSHVELGRLLLAQGRTETALSHLRHAREILPTNPEMLATLTAGLAIAGQLEEAIATCETLAAVRPDDARVRLNLATLLVNHDELARAETELRRALELDPDYEEAKLRLSVLQEHLRQ